MPKQDFKIIPKPIPKGPWWLNYVLIALSAILVFVLVIYLIIGSQINSLEDDKANIDKQIIDIKALGAEKLEKELVAIVREIDDFKVALSSHRETSKLFDFFREICHSQVQFSDLSLNEEENRITLSAITESFKTLGEQMLILQGNQNIKGLALSNISLDKDGKVGFSISFFLPEVFFQ